ncbi:tyrosine-type recombinase/integrase [Pseudoscardovia suis]|uniref:Integrase n=1 Tax=Pseudoscardovia suis TaxID=987063 RepID=A0A261F119_9BIFI|nr:site-specific integrase [Pseudoscardovia suis]OZG52801.1 integrase [Pseudoscardovia suis]PJJ64976.1 site-specific recombinase XerD [Pseudoscardovia suis]
MTTITPYDTKHGRRWRVRYRKPDGSQTDKRGFPRKVDAERWAAENTMSIAHGTYVDPQAGRHTIGSLWPMWIAAKETRCKPSYVATLHTAWAAHVEKEWGGVAVRGVRRQAVQEWVSRLAKTRSASVTLRAYGILAGICRQAVRDGLVPRDPCDGVELPRRTRKQHHYLDAVQLFALADASGWRRGIVLTLGLTGLRWGELVALDVRDLDTARRRLSVSRSMTEVEGELVESEPKTWEHRQVAYPQVLDAVMRGACEGKAPGAPLFSNADGTRLRRTHGPNSTSSWFHWAKKRAGIDSPLTIHDLRHTAASIMVASGASVKAVQRQLGHASAAMTLDTYADLFDDDLDALMGRLGDRIARDCGHDVGTADGTRT